MITLLVEIHDDKTVIQFGEKDGTVTIYPQPAEMKFPSTAGVTIYMKEKLPVAVGITGSSNQEFEEEFDSIVLVQAPDGIQIENLAYRLAEKWEAGNLSVAKLFKMEKALENQEKLLEEYARKLFTIFERFGFHNVLIKKKPAKAQHRWNKEVSRVSFYINYSDSKGEAIWQKRNELLLKKGAKLKPEVPLNKDGSVGYSARLTEKLREDNGDKIKNFVTTEDIVFRSVNELGIFLYYAGTNGWLVLKDKDGKTIDEYTVVKG